jgi:hypothetical protein
MGLLDDAIREHLELKRRRGADPGEVAREQREALEPVPRDRHPEAGGVAVAEDLGAVPAPGNTADIGSSGADDAASVDLDPPTGDSVLDETVASDSIDPSHVVQETAELDMQTVLHEHEDDAVAETGQVAEEESLEWEVPGEAAEAAPDRPPEPHDPGADVQALDAGEDVLEETPEFLRETPEQDRLWFEQRPPRDFDFDK